MEPGLLVLEDGLTYRGQAWAARGEAFGEVVFTTSMTGYQETLTDPSYHRQIVVMTAPHVGNTGVNDEDTESERIWVAGFVVRDPVQAPSNWRATSSLEDELAKQHVVGLRGVDTRALTRRIRSEGSMRAGLFTGWALEGLGVHFDEQHLVQRVRNHPSIHEENLAEQVSTREPYVLHPEGEARCNVVAIDMGIKSMTCSRLLERGARVHVLPWDATIGQVLAAAPDGVFFSNGPGDPEKCDAPVALLREVLKLRIPFFGICLGNQLLGRALGLGTYKLSYGHRGINQPVLALSSRRVEVTSQNHGFAVEAPADQEMATPFGRVVVSHVGLNDQVVEGLRCLDVPAFSVQFHPEAAAGPHDSSHLFDAYIDMMLNRAQEASR